MQNKSPEESLGIKTKSPKRGSGYKLHQIKYNQNERQAQTHETIISGTYSHRDKTAGKGFSQKAERVFRKGQER